MSRLEDQESPSQRETGGCCLGLRRKVGLKAVHVYSRIPERTSRPSEIQERSTQGEEGDFELMLLSRLVVMPQL